MYTEEEKDLITLCSITELSYKCREILYDGMKNRRPDFSKYKEILIKTLTHGVYNKVRAEFSDPNYGERVFAGLKKRGITCVTMFSADYPESLLNTPAPPHVLYCKGNVSLLKTRKFAIVGSRRTRPNVKASCKRMSGEIAEAFTVVSGIADGADTSAVEGALPSGKIISVLAYGFDYFYPACNENLIKQVAEKGLIVSEYPPEIGPQAYYFPARNRIIAGLAEGALIVSAGKRSGALITAGYAADYGREVFAFPYSLGVASGEGCNKLIKEGAYLVENTGDVFSAFGLEFKQAEKPKLNEEELALFNEIREQGEAFIPAVAEKLGKPPYRLIPVLTSLEMKGLIVKLGGNRYAVT